MNESEYLIFNDKYGGILSKWIKDPNLKFLYKEKTNYNSYVYRFFRKYNLPFIRLFYSSWKNERNLSIKYIIIFDACHCKYDTKLLKRNYPNAKIILYLWNKISPINQIIIQDELIDEYWTFDKGDAKKYGFKFNPQFYSKKIILPKGKEEKRVLFLGMEKNRGEYLNKIKDILDDKEIKSNIIIVKEKGQFVKYENYLEMISNSSVLLEVVEGEQDGLTMRTMEALFFEKKLITNNKNIKKYDFYNPNNIFILEDDRIDDLNNFIESNYDIVDNKIIENYDYKNWIARFKKGEG